MTIRDVARVADVHISTVSRALDPRKRDLLADATLARVLAAVDELGYRPHLGARGLRRGQTATIGVVVPDLANPIFAPFARGATQSLDGKGYMPLLADTEDDAGRLERILHHLAERRVEAIIMTAARTGDVDLLLEVAEQGIPLVMAIRTVRDSGLLHVFHDDRLGGRLVAEHLVGLGHRRVGQLKGPLDVEPFLLRAEGFEAALPDDVELVDDWEPARWPTVADGHRIARQVFGSGRSAPTGLFVHNDVLALGALEVLRELGLRCPQDVSIVGYNDAAFAAHTSPALTTVRLGQIELGRRAGELAIRVIDDPDAAQGTESVVPELIVRESTAPPG
ncbi:MAG: LacI family DNA-binding transcriptional regulator [Nitriliruptoraceae bacterium]